MRELLEIYFRLSLNSLGYNSAEVSYSLSYCQGDGACFYNCEILEKVIDRLYPIEHVSPQQKFKNLKQLQILKSGVLEFVDFSVHHNNGRYYHFNSVEVRYDYYNDIEEILELGFWEDEDDFVTFIEDVQIKIQNDVVNICQLMEKHGYALLESTGPDYFEDKEIVFTWETGKYLLQIQETKPDDLMDFYMETEFLISSALSMINQENRMSDFEAILYEKTEDWDSEFDNQDDCEELERISWSCHEYSAGDVTKSGLFNEMIIEVLALAGHNLNQRNNAAALPVAA